MPQNNVVAGEKLLSERSLVRVQSRPLFSPFLPQNWAFFAPVSLERVHLFTKTENFPGHTGLTPTTIRM